MGGPDVNMAADSRHGRMLLNPVARGVQLPAVSRLPSNQTSCLACLATQNVVPSPTGKTLSVATHRDLIVGGRSTR